MSSKLCGCVSDPCPLCKRLEFLRDPGGSDLGFVSGNLCPELCRLFWYTSVKPDVEASLTKQEEVGLPV